MPIFARRLLIVGTVSCVALIAIVATSVLVPADTAFAQAAVGQWPQWRGVHRDGIR